MHEDQPLARLTLPGRRRDERDPLGEQPLGPRLVVGGVPPLAPEQHHRELRLADELEVGQLLDQLRARPRCPQAGLDRGAIGVDAVDGEREPQREPAWAARQVKCVIGRVEAVGVGQRVEI